MTLPPDPTPERDPHSIPVAGVGPAGLDPSGDALLEPLVPAPVGPLLGVIGALTVSNVMANRVLPGWAYVPWNCGMAAAVVTVAMKADGCTLEQLGMSREAVPRGLRLGFGFSAALLGVYGLGLALPGTHDLFLDSRADVSTAELLYKMLIEVPLGTVLLEEVAFRGVLPAMFRRRFRPGRRAGFTADAAAAGLFGLWHVLPAWNVNETNPVFRDTLPDGVGRLTAVLGAVLGTAVVGMFFSWMRNRSDSIAAPAMLHTTSNSVGYLLAWLAERAA